jgi:queuine tRNA-ribosyltransferase
LAQKPDLVFSCEYQKGKTRLGRIRTAHGEFETPVFMPVGTQATVKSVLPEDVWNTGSKIILSNAYHLHLRPGTAAVKAAGGLHRFMNWKGSTLTDSGGFQVMSLGSMVKVTDEGVSFRSHIDGSSVFFSPEVSVGAQVDIGADIIMCFDQCVPYPVSREVARQAVARTTLWAERAKSVAVPPSQALFGIVQGSVWSDLRKESALALSRLDFPGYAIGGLAVGEPKKEFYEIVRFTVDCLPEDRPRYLMGVGHPVDLVEGALNGVDMFDCVLPTRNARHGRAFTFQGGLNLRNRKYASDFGPLEEGCDCVTCREFKRAYLRHLLVAGETLGSTLLTIHNLRFFQRLMERLRESIRQGTAESLRQKLMDAYPFGQT